MAGFHFLRQEERELRRNGLELDLVDRIDDQRRHRRNRFRILRVAQQPNRAQPRLRIRIAKIADDIVETKLLS